MSEQLSLGLPQSRAAARAAGDEAVVRVERGADPEWFRAALQCVRDVADLGTPFTTDDVWLRVGQPREPRALGAVMRHAERLRIAQPTGQYWPSARPECHGRPVRVWRAVP